MLCEYTHIMIITPHLRIFRSPWCCTFSQLPLQYQYTPKTIILLVSSICFQIDSLFSMFEGSADLSQRLSELTRLAMGKPINLAAILKHVKSMLRKVWC